MASEKEGYHPGGSVPRRRRLTTRRRPIRSGRGQLDEGIGDGTPSTARSTRRKPTVKAKEVGNKLRSLVPAKPKTQTPRQKALAAMNQRQQAKSLTRKAKQGTNQAIPTKTQKPSAARARELMLAGDPAAAIRMLKASSGMKNTRLTSQDALNYLKKTGDKAGAQNIMKSSVGLPQQKQVKAKTPRARPTRTLKALIEAKARAMQNQRQQAKMPTIATGRDQRPTARPTARPYRGPARVAQSLVRYMQSRGTAKPARGRVGPTARPQRSPTRGRVR
tara:strand:+ start:151 stop:978 length:828 start_codon:yes stop_codon:yes gene_type:complete